MTRLRQPHELAPLLRDRLRRILPGAGWARQVALRRLAAAALVLLATVLALRPQHSSEDQLTMVLVATRDLAPGALLRSGDLRAGQLPTATVPDGALREGTDWHGRMLVGAVRRGEPMTDLRMIGRELTTFATGDPDAAAVAVRLSDPATAELLRSGSRVDVVALDAKQGNGFALATNAVVLAVHADGADQRPTGRDGRLVVVALPRETATKVAGASLGQPVTVTLR